MEDIGYRIRMKDYRIPNTEDEYLKENCEFMTEFVKNKTLGSIISILINI